MSHNERKVWRTIQVAVDNHNPGYLYAVQELRGAWIKEDGVEEEWEDADIPATTRVMYMSMDKNGRLTNALGPNVSKPSVKFNKDANGLPYDSSLYIEKSNS